MQGRGGKSVKAFFVGQLTWKNEGGTFFDMGAYIEKNVQKSYECHGKSSPIRFIQMLH